MVVIAGLSSHGKTSLGFTIVEAVAVEQRLPVGCFSLEMSTTSLLLRMLCSRARLNIKNVRDGFLAERDLPNIKKAHMELRSAPLYIDAGFGQSITKISAKARRLYQQSHIKLLVIDYLQLIKPQSQKGENRQVEVANISNGIKRLAGELNVPVVVMVQMNSNIEKEKHRKPRLSDLRECIAVNGSFLFTSSGVQNNLSSRMSTMSLNKDTVECKESSNVPKTSNITVNVRLRSGRSVQCTKEHLFLTDRGWVPASKLTTDHAIASVRMVPPPAQPVTVRHGKWIGWMIGNGGMQGYASPTFICSCEDVAQEFIETTRRLFGVEPKPHRHACKSVWQYDLTASTVRTPEGNPIRNWLKAHGLWGYKAPEKHIPEWFLEQADDNSVAALLAGLIETDGSVSRSGSHTSISFTTTSRRLMWQVLWCFNRLGIFARINGGYLSDKANYPCYKISIEEGLEIERFRKVIHLIGRKGKRLNDLSITRRGSNHGDRLGGWVSKTLRAIATAHDLSWHDLGYRDTGKRISQRRLSQVLCNLNKLGVRDKRMGELQALLSTDIFWDRLKSVEPAGRSDVFDRSVPLTHNYIVNGIIVHNSAAIGHDADLVLSLYAPTQDEEENENDGVPMNLRITKNRNGPANIDIKLLFQKAFTRFVPASKIVDADTAPTKQDDLSYYDNQPPDR
jgi:replicative DNA helicase